MNIIQKYGCISGIPDFALHVIDGETVEGSVNLVRQRDGFADSYRTIKLTMPLVSLFIVVGVGSSRSSYTIVYIYYRSSVSITRSTIVDIVL